MPRNEPQQMYFSIVQAAKILGVSRDTVARAISSGALPAADFRTKRTNQHLYRVTMSDIEQFARDRRIHKTRTTRRRRTPIRSGVKQYI